MPIDPVVAARRVIGDDAFRALIEGEAQRLSEQGMDLGLARAVVFDACSHGLAQAASEQVAACREREVTWKLIADAFGKSISAVRHRFDPRTVASHRASMRRRREQDTTHESS